MKTTLEIPDPILRKAKATASAMGISLRQYVPQAVEEKLFQGTRHPGKPWLECAGELAHLLDLTESFRWLKSAEQSFEFWNNFEDAAYEQL